MKINSTLVLTTPHTYNLNNNIISNPGQTEILSYTMDRNSSDQNGLGSNSFSSLITPGPSMPVENENPQIQHQPVPSQIIQSTIMNMKEEPLFYSTDHPEDINSNKIICMKQEAFFQSTVREHCQRKINKQQSSVSIAPHNSQASNNSTVFNIKQETNFRTNLRGINSTNNINLLQRNGTIVSTAPHTYIPSNNIISNPGQTEILSYTMDRNSSDQNGLGSNSFSSLITPGPSMPLENENPQIQHQPVPSQIIQSTIMNMKEEPLFYSTDHPEDINSNRIIRMKQEAFFQSTVREHCQRKINKQQSSVSIAPHNSQASNNSPVLNIKQETNFRTNLRGINSTNNINLLQRNGTIVSTAPHTYIPSNNIISNPGQTEILSYTMDRNSSDQNGLGSNSFSSLITPGPSMPVENENPQIQHQPVPSQIIQSTIMNMKEEPLFYSTDHPEDINSNKIICMKQEAFFQSTVREHCQRKINKQQSSVSIAPHNSQASNNSTVFNIKQETNFRTNLRGINSTNNINLLQRNGTIVSTAPHTYIPSNNIISNPGQTEILSYTMDRNSSDQNGLGSNSFSSLITPGPSMPLENENPQIQHQPVPSQIIQSTIMNMKEEPLFYSTDHPEDINSNRIIRMKQEAFFQSTVREHCQRKINKQQSSVSIAPHNSQASNNSPVFNIKQETNFRTNLRGINSTNNINLLQRNGTIVSTAPHTYIPSNNIISNPGQTEILSYTMDRNSSDQNGLGSNSFSSLITPGPSMPLENENPQIQHQPVPSQIIQSTIMNMKEEPLFYSTDHPEDINSNKIIRMKQEAFFQSTVREHCQRKINKQQSSVSIAPHNSQASNNSPVFNIKQETNFRTNLRGINSTNNINLLQRNGTIVSTAPHTYIPSNNIISNPGQTEILSYTMDRNSSDQNGLGSNSFSSLITPGPSMPLENENPQIQHQPVPSQIIQSTIMNMKEEPLFYSTDHPEDINSNKIIRMKQEAFFQSTVREHCQRKINKQQSSVSIAPHNSQASNNSTVFNIKQETNFRTNLRGINSKNNISLLQRNGTIVSTALGSNSFSSPITPGPSMPLDNENPQIQHQPVSSRIIQRTIMNMKVEPLFYSTDYPEDINYNSIIRVKQEIQSTATEHFQRKINK